MKIGTVRPEEARVFDSKEGFHRFEDDQGLFGSFEVFWFEGADHGGRLNEDGYPTVDGLTFTKFHDETGTEVFYPGWYWWWCFPGCLPDSDPFGPFASSSRAYEDAQDF